MQLKENFSLKTFNTFKVNATAKYFCDFSSIDLLAEILDEHADTKKMVLGGGSNILLTKNFNGIVLKNNIPGINILREDDEYLYVKAGAGVSWHQFVMYCVDNGFGGVENLSLIPGNVGASPMQNIGAYGVEVKDVFHELEAWNLNDNNIQLFNNSDCEFGYRESVFKKKYKEQFIILQVTFRLKKNPVFTISYGAIKDELEKMNVQQLSISAISKAVINIRQSKLPDPAILGNAGSFFKNPEIDNNEFHKLILIEPKLPFYKINDDKYKIPAGWLIEQGGWKGYRKGDVGCYEKQALVLVNHGNASGNEVYDLSEAIKQSVNEKFGINLEREVNII